MNFQLHAELATKASKQACRQTRKVSKQKGSKTNTFQALMFWGELRGGGEGIFHPEKALDLVLLGKGAVDWDWYWLGISGRFHFVLMTWRV